MLIVSAFTLAFDRAKARARVSLRLASPFLPEDAAMAYTQVLKALLHRNLQPRTLPQLGFLVYARAVHALPSVCQWAPAGWTLTHARTRRCFSLDSTARNQSSPKERDGSVSRYQSGSPKPSAAQKVKDAGRDFTYLIVVIIGLSVTGGLLYVVFQELFSSSSPNKVYGKAFNKVRLDPEVVGAFGEPIKCYGETTRRGRRQQVSHREYLKDGLKHMRLNFYIEGSEPGRKGTVHSESIENPETGKYEFRYIYVEVDTYPRRTIIVEDNR